MAGGDVSALPPLEELVQVPERLEATISLDQHIWKRRGARREYDLSMVESFVITPELRRHLTEIFQRISAPYDPQDVENPIGQGWWVQAEYGAGKSHLLAFVTIMATAGEEAWRILEAKERAAGWGRRESLAQFGEGIQRKRIFPLVKNLVGGGGARVGTEHAGRPLIDYLLEAAQEAFQEYIGRRLHVFPDELVVGHFLEHHLELFSEEFQEFLKPLLGERALEGFLEMVEEGDLRDAGELVWQFYERYRLRPEVPVDTRAILLNMVREILAAGYDGVLVVLDEVSEFLRRSASRQADEDVLLTLGWPLVRVENLPIWTLCAAQQRLEEQEGARKIVSPERLKALSLLERDDSYYDIVLARTRKLLAAKGEELARYYEHYQGRFRWVRDVSLAQFRRFFPFHPQSLSLARHLTSRLSTARSGIALLHGALRTGLEGRELIAPAHVFDQLASGPERAGYADDHEAYRLAAARLSASHTLSRPALAPKAERALKVLFLEHLSGRRASLSAQEMAGLVMLPRSEEATIQENEMHYQLLLRDMSMELPEVGSDNGYQTFYFRRAGMAESPPEVFARLVVELKGNAVEMERAYQELLRLEGLMIGGRRFGGDLRSDFHDIAPSGGKAIQLAWRGREVFGRLEMQDLSQPQDLPRLDTPATGHDFLGIVSSHNSGGRLDSFLAASPDSRYLFWEPRPWDEAFREGLAELAAYLRMIHAHVDRESQEAQAALNWAAERLLPHLGRLKANLTALYRGGRMASRVNPSHQFSYVGNLETALEEAVGEALDASYRSREISFPPGSLFTDQEALLVINALVRFGHIRPGTPEAEAQAGERFGLSLGLVREADRRRLSLEANPYAQALAELVRERAGGEALPLDTLYRNFMGPPWGLSRRLVQVYVLALAREGVLKVGLKSGSWAGVEEIEARNIAQIEFTSRVLRDMVSVRAAEGKEKWAALRPFLPVLLGEAEGEYEKALASLFAEERESIAATKETIERLCAGLPGPNPYRELLVQWEALFRSPAEAGPLAWRLQEAFGYRLEGEPEEARDFRERWRTYRGLSHFQKAGFGAMALRLLDFRDMTIPSGEAFRALAMAREKALSFLDEFPALFVEEIRLETEFRSACQRLEEAYARAYERSHAQLYALGEEVKAALRGMLDSREMRALRLLDRIEALGEPAASEVEEGLKEALGRLPHCQKLALEDGLACRNCRRTLSELEAEREHLSRVLEDGQGAIMSALRAKAQMLQSGPILARLKESGADEVARQAEAADIREFISYFVKEMNEELAAQLQRAASDVLVVPISWEELAAQLPAVEEGEEEIEAFLAQVRAYMEEKLKAHRGKGVRVILRWQR